MTQTASNLQAYSTKAILFKRTWEYMYAIAKQQLTWMSIQSWHAVNLW